MTPRTDDPLFDPEPEPPEPPHDGECCESGCGDLCVWTQYALARADFERARAAWLLRHPPEAHFP